MLTPKENMNKWVKIMISILVAVLVIGGARFFYLGSQSAQLNPKLGIINERLIACPDKPNCVSSFDSDKHYIKPIKSSKSLAEIKKSILELKNVKLISEEDNYLHFTFSSNVFSFIDDLELLHVDNKYHLRSSSRVGHSDLGANRKRIEKLRVYLSK